MNPIPVDHEDYGPPAQGFVVPSTQASGVYEVPPPTVTVLASLSVVPNVPAAEINIPTPELSADPQPPQPPQPPHLLELSSPETPPEKITQPEKRKRMQTVRMNMCHQRCNVCSRRFYSESAFSIDGFVCSFECWKFAN